MHPGLEDSLIETLGRSDLMSVLKDGGELALDSVLDAGLLRDIPVLGALHSIWKTGTTMRDLLFQRKLLRFLFELRELSADERQDMIRRLEHDHSYSQKVGESLILLLDRLDHLDKPKLVARAFTAFCRGQIDASELQRINYIIDRIFLPDLDSLDLLSQRGALPDYVLQSFVNTGLARPSHDVSANLEKTTIGETFMKHVLKIT